MALCVTTFIVAFVSGLVPFVNAEAYLLSVAVLVPGVALGGIVAAATLGQMTAKCLLYLTGRGLIRLPQRRPQVRSKQVTAFLQRGDARAAAVVFASALAGLPPFYVVTVTAGALGFPFRRFVAIGVLGRLLRFGAVFLVPRFL